jgi:hypothetical protein
MKHRRSSSAHVPTSPATALCSNSYVTEYYVAIAQRLQTKQTHLSKVNASLLMAFLLEQLSLKAGVWLFITVVPLRIYAGCTVAAAAVLRDSRCMIQQHDTCDEHFDPTCCTMSVHVSAATWL